MGSNLSSGTVGRLLGNASGRFLICALEDETAENAVAISTTGRPRRDDGGDECEESA